MNSINSFVGDRVTSSLRQEAKLLQINISEFLVCVLKEYSRERPITGFPFLFFNFGFKVGKYQIAPAKVMKLPKINMCAPQEVFEEKKEKMN